MVFKSKLSKDILNAVRYIKIGKDIHGAHHKMLPNQSVNTAPCHKKGQREGGG